MTDNELGIHSPLAKAKRLHVILGHWKVLHVIGMNTSVTVMAIRFLTLVYLIPILHSAMKRFGPFFPMKITAKNMA